MFNYGQLDLVIDCHKIRLKNGSYPQKNGKDEKVPSQAMSSIDSIHTLLWQHRSVSRWMEMDGDLVVERGKTTREKVLLKSSRYFVGSRWSRRRVCLVAGHR